ncbi:hNH endonuclease, partial [Escherichia coli]
NDYCMCGSAMKDHVHSGCGYPTGMFDYYYNQWLESDNKTPATDAFLAEVRAQCLNAFIQHHSAELDAHIKNSGEQFDEKSVRIRDIIVSARLFREQIRKGAAL